MLENKTQSGIAAVLSFIFNGLGHIYLGQIKKGLFIIFLSVVFMAIFITGASVLGINFINGVFFSKLNIFAAIFLIVGLTGIGIVGIYSILDSYKTAVKA